MKGHVLSAILSLHVSFFYAQNERWISDRQHGKQTSFAEGGLWIEGSAALLSNRISNEIGVNMLQGDRITPSMNTFLASMDPSSSTRIQAGIAGNSWYRWKGKNKAGYRIGFGLEDALFANLRTGVVQSLLLGNGPFEDQRLSLSPSTLKYFSYQYIGFGVDYSTNKLLMGANVQLVKLSRWQQLTCTEGRLFTAPYGEYLSLALEGQTEATSASQSKSSAWYGTGGAIDLFLILGEENGPTMVSFQIQRLGLVHLSGVNSFQYAVDTVFRGLDAGKLMSKELTISSQIEHIDSLDQLFNSTYSHDSKTVLLPGYFSFDWVQQLGEKASFAIEFRQYFTSVPPSIRLGLRTSVFPWLSVEPYAQMGGFSRFDGGVTLGIHAKDRCTIRVVYGLIERQLLAAQSSSQQVATSVHIRL